MVNHVDKLFLDILSDIEDRLRQAHRCLDNGKPLPEMKDVVQEYEDARITLKR